MSEESKKPESGGRVPALLTAVASLISALAWPIVLLICLCVLHDPLKKTADALAARATDFAELEFAGVKVRLREAEKVKTDLGEALDQITALYAVDKVPNEKLREPVDTLFSIMKRLQAETNELKREKEQIASAKGVAGVEPSETYGYGKNWGADFPKSDSSGLDWGRVQIHLESKGGPDTPALKQLHKELRALNYNTDENGPNRSFGDVPKVFSNPASLELADKIRMTAEKVGYTGVQVEKDQRLKKDEFIVYTADAPRRDRTR